MQKIAILLFFLFLSCQLRAQTWEVGGEFGGAGYSGDLNPDNPVKPSGLAGGLFVKRNFDGYWVAKLNLGMGKISAYDSKSNNQQFRDRNLSFTDVLKEVSLIGEFNFMNYIPDAGKNKYTPYIYTGFGITSFAPRTKFNGQTYSLRNLKTEGEPSPYAKSTMAIPYGVGIKYNFSSKWTAAADLGYRYTFTDYLDDVSGSYANPAQFSSDLARKLADRSGEVGKPPRATGSQRGDFKPHDTYFFLGITISYTFVTQRCYY